MKNFKFIFLFIFLLILGLTTYLVCPQTNTSESKKTETLPTITQKYFSDYTGIETSKSEKNNTPFLVMIENSNQARPQSGLSSADVIFETTAEGGIPRFMALFQSEYPKSIGPVRSVRPYYLTIAYEHNMPFAHCGGSQEALNEIATSSSLMSLNEISSGKYFWRDSSKKAPHNLYTSSNNILEAIKNKNWLIEPNSIMSFNSTTSLSPSYTNCNSYFMKISNYYNTSYTYSNGLYVKYMNGELAIDANNNNPLSFSNVIIQKTNMTTQPDNIHLDIDMIGEGSGQLLRNGKIQDIHWSKSSNTSKTIIKDLEGNELSLSPGKTIWHIIDKSIYTESK